MAAKTCLWGNHTFGRGAQFLTDSRGVPGNIEVIESAGEEFDWEGVLSVSQWRYRPGARSFPLTAVIDWQQN